MVKCIVQLAALFAVAAAFPFSNFIQSDDTEDEDTGIMDFLLNYGDKLFTLPNNKTGEEVSKWAPDSAHNPEELGEYTEGDIRFPQTAKSLTRNGLKATSARWPKGVVPYELSPEFSYNSASISMLNTAIADYNKLTCVRWVPRSNAAKQPDYVYITSGNTGCWSSVGRIGGRQELNLQSPGCVTKKGTVMHEMMHALGFLHEQNRWERDKHVTVNYNNIESGRENNFEKAKKQTTDNQGVSYDYRSVMHYSSNAFSRNGQPTIEPKVRGVTLGQRDNLSRKDVQKIRHMYKCGKRRSV